MEKFINKTDVSFSQLFKKDGWFARLIFIQLIVCPINTLFNRILKPPGNSSDWVYWFIIIALHLMIAFLLWKKRTRLTITVAIILLWVLFLWKRALPFFALVLMLFTELIANGVNSSLTSNRTPVLIGAVVGSVITFVLTVIWTRNLTRLNREYV